MKNKTTLRQRIKLRYVALLMVSGQALAADETLGSMASQITQSFASVSKLITAGAYVAGLGFAVSAILKFKAHKDNPQQTAIGVPIGLTFVAAALLFLPSMLGITGATLFSGGGKVGGPTGIVFSTGG